MLLVVGRRCSLLLALCRCLLPVVSRLSFVDCYSLSGVFYCCSLFVVWCLVLCGVCVLLSAACLLFVVGCCSLCVVNVVRCPCLLFVVCCGLL